MMNVMLYNLLFLHKYVILMTIPSNNVRHTNPEVAAAMMTVISSLSPLLVTVETQGMMESRVLLLQIP